MAREDHHRPENETFSCVWGQHSGSVLQFGTFSQKVQYLIIQYPSCLCLYACLAKSSLEIHLDWEAEHKRSCVPALLGTDLIAKPPVFLLRVCASVYVCMCICVKAWMSVRDASPAQNSSVWLHQRDLTQRDHWASEKKSLPVCILS